MNLGLLSQQPDQQQTAEDILRFLLGQEKRAQMAHQGAQAGPGMRAHSPLNQWAWGVANRATKPGILRDEIASSVYGHRDWADLVKTFLGQREAQPEGIPFGMGAIMAGPKAAKASLEMLEIAKDAEKRGMSRDRIFDATGWFKGADKKWRFEIDDSGARIHDAVFNPTIDQGQLSRKVETTDPQVAQDYGISTNTMRLKEFLDHPGFEQSYVHAPIHSPTFMMARLGGNRGMYFPDIDEIAIDSHLKADPSEARSVTLHELQHGIQNREKFARGGGPDEPGMGRHINPQWVRWNSGDTGEKRLYEIVRSKEYRDSIEGSNRLWDEKYKPMLVKLDDDLGSGRISDAEVFYRKQDEIFEASSREVKEKFPLIDEVDKLKQAGLSEDPPAKYLGTYNAYLRLAGETEARNVQKRRDYTADYRRMLAPWKTQDYPDEEQILLGL